MTRKPGELHARDREWDALADFASDPAEGRDTRIAVRASAAGKTLMLELLAEATGGFMFTAREQPDRQNRRALSAAYARYAGLPASLAFDDWADLVEGHCSVWAAQRLSRYRSSSTSSPTSSHRCRRCRRSSRSR
jgi:hypothetical protein